MNLIWSDRASNHLVDIRDYYNQFSEKTADEMVDRIIARCYDLLEFPLQGVVRRDVTSGDAHYVIKDYYRITYVVQDENIYILSVFDSRQNPEKDML